MTEQFSIPTIVPMESIPPNSNPYHTDLYHMGCQVSGAWEAMFSEHAGLKQDHNLTEEERAAKEKGGTIWNPDPNYIIFVNKKTGQRFKMIFKEANDISDTVNSVLRQRIHNEVRCEPIITFGTLMSNLSALDIKNTGDTFDTFEIIDFVSGKLFKKIKDARRSAIVEIKPPYNWVALYSAYELTKQVFIERDGNIIPLTSVVQFISWLNPTKGV